MKWAPQSTFSSPHLLCPSHQQHREAGHGFLVSLSPKNLLFPLQVSTSSSFLAEIQITPLFCFELLLKFVITEASPSLGWWPIHLQSHLGFALPDMVEVSSSFSQELSLFSSQLPQTRLYKISTQSMHRTFSTCSLVRFIRWWFAAN